MKMDLFIALAHSVELDTFLAVTEIIENCELQLGNQKPTAGIFYAGIDANHQLALDKIYEKWPNLQLVGCTTDGEFSSECEYVEDSLALTLFGSKEMKIVSGFINNDVSDVKKECSQALSKAVSRLGQIPKLCILFSDVLKTSGETVMEQLTIITDGNLPIVGGISADSWRFIESKQFCNKISSSSISPFLLLAGSFDFSCGMNSGWEAIGDAGIITKSKGNVVYEIDNSSALEFYSNILGENTKPTLELPIAVYDNHGDFSFMRTTFENYDNNIGSVTYLGNIPVGYKVRITMVNRESILSSTISSVNHAVRKFPSNKSPVLALCFSCSARRVLLGTRTIEECQIVHNKIGKNVKFIGFYTYGEFCPNLKESTNKFYNETFVTVLIG